MPGYKKMSGRRKKTGKKLTKTQTLQVKRLVNKDREPKQVQIVTAAQKASSTGVIINPVPTVAQGDAYNQRSGNEVTPTSIKCRGRIVIGPAALASVVRVLIFRASIQFADFPNTSTIMNEIFLDCGDQTTTFGTTPPYSPINKTASSYNKLWHIISDKTYLLSNQGNSRQLALNINIKKSHLRKLHMTAASSDAMEKVYILLWGSETFGGGNGPACDWNGNMYYTDA